MPTCVVVLQEKHAANDLLEKLTKGSNPLTKCDLVKPSLEQGITREQKEIHTSTNPQSIQKLEPVSFESVNLLNPMFSKSIRRKTLSLWLMPFGFIAGLSFSNMTGLETFSNLGFPRQLETLLGGVLGMTAGWIGSFFAAGNPSQDINDDLMFLKKKSSEGLWLLIIETPMEIELPWGFVQESNPTEVVILKEF